MADDDGRAQMEEGEREISSEDSSALATISRAEIDIQIATAKRWPRSIDHFKKTATTLATLDEDTAASMYYRVPRDGKMIEGASIRMAEIAGSSWGNLHYGGRQVSEDDRFLVAQGVAWDLESNVRANIEVRRRITNKYGKRYSDDMIITTSNAAISIALRNAILRVVPAALIRGILAEAKEVSTGKGLSMAKRRELAFDYLEKKAGAKHDEVLRVLGRRGDDDIDIEDLITLRGMGTAIRDGDMTWKEILEEATKAQEEEPPTRPTPRKASDLARELENADKEPPADSNVQAGGSTPSASTEPPKSEPPKAEPPKPQEPAETFQASTDPLSPEQQGALVTAIGRARLSKKQVEALCTKYKIQAVTDMNVGQFQETMTALIELAQKPGGAKF